MTYDNQPIKPEDFEVHVCPTVSGTQLLEELDFDPETTIIKNDNGYLIIRKCGDPVKFVCAPDQWNMVARPLAA